MTTLESLRTLCRDQAVWSNTASRLKADIGRARWLVLASVIVTAVLEALAAQMSAAGLSAAAKIPAAVGAVVIAAGAVLQARPRTAERIRQWTRSRSASEALKEQMFRCLTRTGQYAGPEADAVLRQAREAILGKVKDLELFAAATPRVDCDPPAIASLADYVKIRVEGQIDGFYQRRAAQLAKSGARWRAFQTVLMLASAVLGALVAFVPGVPLAGWVAVLTTVAAAVGAHTEAARYEALVVDYRSTAARLESLRDEWRDALSRRPLTQDEQTDFVNRCEDAISVENQAWMAEWASKN